ncbi:hypothetical protein MUB24_03210 [Lederbergia sp. NSJ-179]|uniref:hypothetical protein n=1 Tax=Lederbergia sp. NSJ-179 TaxID=2931402 RepID=UPI001FD17CEA|nr:hypothetical protein [Lederbergia sp. NSJ-179]MCJ7839937.1 hypothetical protein [Lederbergia sp. NSJ-179]
MKIILLGIAIILFGATMILAFSSTGFGYVIGTKFGLAISIFGLLISIVSCFINNKK